MLLISCLLFSSSLRCLSAVSNWSLLSLPSHSLSYLTAPVNLLMHWGNTHFGTLSVLPFFLFLVLHSFFFFKHSFSLTVFWVLCHYLVMIWPLPCLSPPSFPFAMYLFPSPFPLMNLVISKSHLRVPACMCEWTLHLSKAHTDGIQTCYICWPLTMNLRGLIE